MRDYEDEPLGSLLYQVMAELRPRASAELQLLGLGLPEFVCLRNLLLRPGQSNAELARIANVSPQAMSMVMRGLQNRGVITGPTTASAGRARPAHLTAEGRALLERAEASVQVADECLLQRLTLGERRELKRLLDAVRSNAVDRNA